MAFLSVSSLVAWAISDPQILVEGNQVMRMEFDGKILYDQLPISPNAKPLKLVAIKIFSGNLSSETLESEASTAVITPAYSRNQFEPSTQATQLFQDDMENGTRSWTWESPVTGLTTSTWHSGDHEWVASISTIADGSLTTLWPIDFSNYTQPAIRFVHAYRMASVNDQVSFEISLDGESWKPLASYTGLSPHWLFEQVDLSSYGETNHVQMRFRAHSQNSLLWYLDDVFLHAYPAVKTASFTYQSPIFMQTGTTIIAGYTSIDTTLPITYQGDFCGVQRETTPPEITYEFPNSGDCLISLMVKNPYDSAVTSQTISIKELYKIFLPITPLAGSR